jgi:nucleoside-diphosphate-sugar epimerase
MESVQPRYRGTVVAVTGASGYLGAALVAALRDAGARVIAASRRPIAADEAVEWAPFDLRSQESWARLLDRAGVVFHLAGNTSVYDAERDPGASLSTTVLPITLMEASAHRAGRIPRVVFASTATVYGLTERLPVDETAAANPITAYDRHKLQAERQLLSAPHLDGVVLRLSNVYGPSPARCGASERGFLNRSVERALHGHDIEVYGDGRLLRDFVHIDDVIAAFLIAGVTQPVGDRCFNIANGTATSLRDAVSLAIGEAARVSGRTVALRETSWPDDAHAIERRNFAANIDRARAVLRWQPAVTLAGGIARFAEQARASEAAR